MQFIKVGKENSSDIALYYEDHGKGKPVVLIHGWPLSLCSWEKQVAALVGEGYRVIAYDRRGFGLSSKPYGGYDYDTLASDLHQIIKQLELQEVVLAGFSMGGGEVARYLGKFGTKQVSGALFISSITPFLLKTNDNKEGLEESVFESLRRAILADRPAFLSKFLSDFYNLDLLLGKKISEEAVTLSWNIASMASPAGTFACVSSWLTDFREDLKKIDVPVMVVHGDEDRTLPIQATGKRMVEFIRNCRLAVIEGAPHGLLWTHADALNREMLNFISMLKSTEGKARAA